MVRHGLASTYRNARYKCRCDECRAANTLRTREEKRRRADLLAADPTLAPHGKRTTYTNWGCRCRPCTADHSAMLRENRARRAERRQS